MLTALGLLVGVILVGTLGYVLLEDVGFTRAFYMTIVTISTVGFSEIIPLGTGGVYFTIFLIVFGVGAMLFFLGSVFEFILSEYLGDIWGRRRMNRKISHLQGHYIVCGYGRVGKSVADEFKSHGLSFVVVDIDEEICQRCVEDGNYALCGSATDTEVLQEAGIQDARGLISALKSDADNVYVILTAKVARPDMLLVARADEPGAEKKLELVGADHVISPHKIAGKRMVNMMLYPGACEFVDVVTGGKFPGYRLSEIVVERGSPLLNKTIKDTRLRERTGVMILSVKKAADDSFNHNPAPSLLIEEGDELMMIGTPEQMSLVEKEIMFE